MKKITISIGLAVVLVLPVTAVAKLHPDRGDRRAAKAECTTLRGNTDATREAFSTQFRNFGACVTRRALDEAREEQNAHMNAARFCRAERTRSLQDFRTTWGKNTNGRNAFGKCVSATARAKEHAADEKDQQEATERKNAAEQCDADRDASAETFATTWGTDEDAFGRCVSTKAEENNEEPTQQS